MRQLYPPLEPYTTTVLAVDDLHRVYVERCGAAGALPVVFLHGGPGSGCKPDHRQFFDPRRYDIVLFDQRGSGRSQPCAEVERNDTQALIADMETIRRYCGFERWVVSGGSWGAALALAYAQTHPDRVLGLVLRGVFLARDSDLLWFAGGGARRMLPREWRRFESIAAQPPERDLIAWLHEGIFGDDASTRERLALAWSDWSTAVVMFSFDQAGEAHTSDAASALAKARIEMHYARHRYFLDEDQLLRDAARLPSVPVTIIHGGRDLTCTPDAAFALHQAVPQSKLEILRSAGHLSSEAAMVDALVRASDALADELAARSV